MSTRTDTLFPYTTLFLSFARALPADRPRRSRAETLCELRAQADAWRRGDIEGAALVAGQGRRARRGARDGARGGDGGAHVPAAVQGRDGDDAGRICPASARRQGARAAGVHEADGRRSEEHTSELQSLMRTPYAVF